MTANRLALAALCLVANGVGLPCAQAQTEVAPIPPTKITSPAERAAWQEANERIGAARDAGRTADLTGLAERALQLGDEAFGPGAPETMFNVRYLADRYCRDGRDSDAVPLYERFIASTRNDNDVMIIIEGLNTLNALNNLGTIHQRQGRFAQAEPLFARAIKVSERWMGADHPDTLSIRHALVIARLGDPALASGALEPARALAEDIRTRRRGMASPGVLSRQASGDLGNRSVDVLQQLSLAHVQAARNRANDLDAFALLAQAAWARVREMPDTRPKVEAEAFLAIQDAISGIASKAVEQMAVRLAAETRAPGLGALVRERQLLDDQRILNEDEAARAIANRGDDWMERDAAVYKEGYRISTAIERADARLRAEFPDYFTFAGNDALSIAETQKLLGPDEAILLAFQSPFGTQVMGISRTGFKWSRSNWTNERMVMAIKRLLWDVGLDVGIDSATSARWEDEAGDGYPFDRKTAHDLYRELVEPVSSVLKNKRHVYVATGGALSSLPFGILVTEPPKGKDGDPKALRKTRWLADAHALAVIPSIQSLKFLRKAAAGSDPGGPAGESAFAGYGDPALSGKAQDRGSRSGRGSTARSIFQGSLSRSGNAIADIREIRSLARLPGTATELENLRVALGAPATAVHLQQQATETAFRTADLSHVRILALATHGLMAGELAGAAEPGLVFTPPATASDADDGFLTASEVTTVSLDADWVILSACNTAAGDGSEGAPGLSGLARAFFYAGARNLLVSHWPVRDAVAARITVDAISRQRSMPGSAGRKPCNRRCGPSGTTRRTTLRTTVGHIPTHGRLSLWSAMAHISGVTTPPFLTGKLLLAMPGIGDPRFERSVIAICQHDEEGALGIGIGRIMPRMGLHALLDQFGIEPGSVPDVPIHAGGPVEPQRGFVLHTLDWSGQESLQVSNLWGLTATIDILRVIGTERGPSQWLVALGYAGWGPGQLDEEMHRHGWHVADANDVLLFDMPVEERWSAAFEAQGIDPRLLAVDSGHA